MIRNRFYVLMGYFRGSVIFLLFFLVLNSTIISHPEVLFSPGYPFFISFPGLDLIFNRGEGLYQEGKFEQALEVFQTASLMAESKKETKSYLECRFYVGLCYWVLSRIEDSYQEYSKLLDKAAENEFMAKQSELKKVVELIDLYRLGIELRHNREFQDSLDVFKEALESAKKISRKEMEQRILRQLSITYLEMSDLRRFNYFNRLSLELAGKINHREEVGKCLNNKGIFHWKSFDYSKALSSYTQALDVFKGLDNKEEESNILHNLGLVYKDFGYYDRAMDHLKQALEIDQKMEGYEYFPIDYMNIGTICKLKAGDEKNNEWRLKAIEYFQKSFSLAKTQGNEVIKIMSLNNIGSSYIETKEYSKALPYLEESLKKAEEIHDFKSMSMILNNIGYVYLRTGESPKAERYFKSSVQIAQDHKAYDTLWEAFFRLGILNEKKGNFSEAVEHYLSSIRAIETVKDRIELDFHNAGFVQSKLKVYENLMDLLFYLYEKNPGNEYGEKMFLTAERSKARVLLENLSSSEFNHAKEISFDRKDLMTYMLEEIQNYLAINKAVLFEYFLGDHKSYLFRITRKKLDVFPLPSKKLIAKSIQGYLKMLKSPPKGKFKGRSAAKRIYRELMFPMRHLAPDSFENIIIIPSGILYYLPFETLVNPECENDYLISRYRVSYMPSSVSLIYLSLNRKEKTYKKDLLAFGNPVIKEKIKSGRASSSNILIQLYQNQDFDFFPLPYSEKEIRSISKFFNGNRRDVFLKEHALEETLKKTRLLDYKIIHFSCHGFLDENYPSRSSLVLSLADGREEDGFLQVKEIYDLRIKPQLVVLSACQTGRGAIKRGEGVLGLPRVFFYAGAESILTSLWRVRDKQTAEFMKLFYECLDSGKNKSHSLQLAKKEFIKSRKYSHPFYWAPFILNGEFIDPINF